MSLFFAEHGPTSASEDGIIEYEYEPLSDAGIAVAREIGRNLLQLLGERKLHYMMVPPTKRALQTAQLVREGLPYGDFVQHVLEDRLVPRRMATYTGTSVNTVPWQDESALAFNGVESLEDVQARHDDLASEIRNEWRTMNGLIIGHNSSIRPLTAIANMPEAQLQQGQLLVLEP